MASSSQHSYRPRSAASDPRPVTRPSPDIDGPGTSPSGRFFGSFRKKVRRNSAGNQMTSSVGSAPTSNEIVNITPPKRGIWENIRPRSKSDSRTKHMQPIRHTMHTIPSVDESMIPDSPDKLSNKHVRPLFVDTQLANDVPSDKNRRSPVAKAVMDFVRGRNRAQSASPGVGISGKTVYGRPSSTATEQFGYYYGSTPPPRSPIGAKLGSGPSPIRYRIGMLPQQRSLDSGLEMAPPSPSTAIIMKPPYEHNNRESNDFEFSRIILENQDLVYSMFARAHKCYDLIPTSTKLVVFDTQLPVRKAFFALVYNGVRAAPLWDSEQQEFVGMLTITDFIHILYKYYRSGQSGGIRELEEHKIATWRDELQKDGRSRSFVTIDPTENLQKSVEVLLQNRVHRLPVIDRASGNISYILTHKRIIKFLYLYINDLPRPAFMDQSIKELGVGTWGHVECVTPETPLIKALSKFLDFKVSALPILDDQGRVVDIYAKFDVINLAAEKSYNNLEVTVGEALKHRSEWFEGVCCCLESDTLGTVIDKLVKAEVHRLICTDIHKRVVGVVSLSDVLKFLVLNPPNSDLGTVDTMDDS